MMASDLTNIKGFIVLLGPLNDKNIHVLFYLL